MTLKSALKKCALFALFGLGVANICLTCSNDRIRKENAQYEYNIKALNDSLHVYQLKDSSSVASKMALLQTQAELQRRLTQAGVDIKELQKKLDSKVNSAIGIDAAIKIDTIYVPGVGPDYGEFMYNTKWIRFNAKVDSAFTMTNLYIPAPMYVGTTEDNKVWVRSENPYVHVTDIKASLPAPKKPNKWNIGITVGPGAYYSFTKGGVDAGFGATFGITYNIW